MIRPSTIRYAVLGCIFLSVLVSIEIFNIALTGLSEEAAVRQTADLRPQIASLTLWLLVILLSFVPGAARLSLPRRPMLWPTLMLLWVVASSWWSDNPIATSPKALALLVTCYGAWRATSVITTAEMFACLYYALGALLAASIVLVFLVPSVGVVQREWQHVGNWQGVFSSKQGLGMVAAVFLGIALLRLANRWWSWQEACLAAVGLMCLLGSGSRGAGLVALVAVSCLIVSRYYPRLAVLIIGVLWIDMALAVANIIFFAISGRQSIEILDFDLNFTERTFIWQYALGMWRTRPLLGYGLNGFWTNPDIYYAYLRLHGWVLDNYHDGYVAIIMETGIVGFTLFGITATKLTAQLHRLLRETPRSRRLPVEMTIVFLVMFFTINLTETYFLRSTNFMSVLFAFLVAKTFTAAPIVPEPVVSRHRALATG